MLASLSTTNTPLEYNRQHTNRERWLEELGEFLAFPTISAAPRHRHDVEMAARWLREHLARLGMEHAQVLPGPDGGGPSVYADWLCAPGQPTLLLYGHYDVQPVDPLHEWRTPPFQPTRIGSNLYARGASDDKGQFFMHLKALESYLETAGTLPINVKVWIEGEEEISSPNLAAFLERDGERLRADAVLVSDTEMAAPQKPSLIYGLRGNLIAELGVRGPRHDLHSGRYGGAVLNPLQALCEVVAKLHDRNGRVAIPGFYDCVHETSAQERHELRQASSATQMLLKDLDIPALWGEPDYSPFERMTIRPALTINGLRGGYVGSGSKAVIPSRAEARLSFRLVPDQQPAEIAHLLRRYIEAIAPPAVSVRIKVAGGAMPVILPRRHPAVYAAARAIERVWGVPPVFTRSGGTIAFVTQLQRYLRAPIILMGFGLPDDHVHAPNEKMSLPNFFRGVETVIQFFEECRR